jgi:ABC-type multidrug transport system ATPase subunit
MRLDVSNLSKDIGSYGKKRRIIEGINLSILPREFVAIVGGSGAGKTTLLNALIGIRPGDGQVNLNGYDFYKEYDHFRSSLGYVPQSDILHTSLTVEKALN